MSANTVSRPITAGSWLVDELRRAIIVGEFPAGMLIRQEELASRYKVSRMPVRQALDILAAEGWILLEPHKGATVTALDANDAAELFELREAVEAVAIRRSFPALTDDQLSALDEAWAALRAAEGDDVALHQSFHMSLYAAAGPRVRRTVLRQLEGVQRYLSFEKATLQVHAADHVEHAELVAAAHARDPERGLRVLRKHVGDGGRSIAARIAALIGDKHH